GHPLLVPDIVLHERAAICCTCPRNANRTLTNRGSSAKTREYPPVSPIRRCVLNSDQDERPVSPDVPAGEPQRRRSRRQRRGRRTTTQAGSSPEIARSAAAAGAGGDGAEAAEGSPRHRSTSVCSRCSRC